MRSLILLLVVAAPLVARAADPAEAAYESARRAYRALRDDPAKMKFRHHWLKVGRQLEGVAQKYPASSRAVDALFSAGRLYHDLYRFSGNKEDLERSCELLRRVVREHPQHRLADDAQWLLVLRHVEFERDPISAREELNFLLAQFPKGDMAGKARRLLEDLGGPEAEDTPPVTKEPEKTQPGAPAEVPTTAPPAPDSVPAPAPAPEATPVLEEIHHWSDTGYTRIALYVRDRRSFRSGVLSADAKARLPTRVYVDLPDTLLAPEVPLSLSVGDGVVKRIRVAVREGGVVRVVADLDRVRQHRVFPLDDPSRVVLDIGDPPPPPAAGDGFGVDGGAAVSDGGAPDAGEGTERDTVADAGSAGPDGGVDGTATDAGTQAGDAMATPDGGLDGVHFPGVSLKPGVSLSVLAGLKVKKVVLDPGHGGSDPGAVGVGGILEKDLTLDLARRLKKKLEKLKLEVKLTRDGDRFVALEERTAIANTARADLFISLHFNAHKVKKLSGIETFYLDLTDDRYSLKLAARENATSEKSISDLQYILADLALKSHVEDSAVLARQVQASLVGSLRKRYKKVRDLKVKYALFYVLLGARMPAILVEASFISNPDEAARCADKTYRERLAEAIAKGVEKFMSGREIEDGITDDGSPGEEEVPQKPAEPKQSGGAGKPTESKPSEGTARPAEPKKPEGAR
ncbi:MAG: AMIN domain-containing protein [Myxococcales bacterium]|nr:AMIN domain-containing protein [Myxococcales bacterium]